MQIPPGAALALNVLYAVLAGLTLPVVDSLGFASHDTQIVAWALIGVIVMNAILHGYSAPLPGPLAPPVPPVVKAAQAVADIPPNAPETSPRVQIAKAVARRAIEDHQP
jgi:hypothetical protein